MIKHTRLNSNAWPGSWDDWRKTAEHSETYIFSTNAAQEIDSPSNAQASPSIATMHEAIDRPDAITEYTIVKQKISLKLVIPKNSEGERIINRSYGDERDLPYSYFDVVLKNESLKEIHFWQ